MTFKNILFEKQDNIARITLNQPEKRNTFDPETRNEMVELFDQLAGDNTVKVVVLTGAGKAFSSGGDISKMEGSDFTPVAGRKRLKRGDKIIRTMLNFEKPIIAAVNGVAAGAGATVALACDIIIASDKAKFGFGFVKIGLVPDLGSHYLLPLRIGIGRSKELLMTGDFIDAEEAERIGMINRVVTHDQLENEALSLAALLAAGPGQALAMIKSTLNRWPTDLTTILEMESAMQAIAFNSDDFAEGRKAFLEKRKPVFRGS